MRFLTNLAVILKLEADRGEFIFLNRLGEPG